MRRALAKAPWEHCSPNGSGSRSAISTPVIVERTGKSIADIFADDGEATFRTLEQQITTELLPLTGVLSLGGGSGVVRHSPGRLFVITELASGCGLVWRRL